MIYFQHYTSAIEQDGDRDEYYVARAHARTQLENFKGTYTMILNYCEKYIYCNQSDGIKWERYLLFIVIIMCMNWTSSNIW